MLHSRRNAVLKGAALLFLSLILSGAIFSYWVGAQLVAPRPAIIGPPPADLHAESIVTGSEPEALRGWWIPGDNSKGTVLLLHGIRANRLAMVGRARMLVKHGYSVLMVDLQGHGESPGNAITLGLRESIGVQAARDWIRNRRPGRPIAAIGVSLGGASILLGPSPSGFDAVVLEAVYPDARQALRNRMAIRFGSAGPMLAKLLEIQVKPRLGVSLDQLRPIDRIAGVAAPVLVVAGGRDQHTTLTESESLYACALKPKEFFLLPDATHQDFQRHAPAVYEARVTTFLDRVLHGPRSGPSLTSSCVNQ